MLNIEIVEENAMHSESNVRFNRENGSQLMLKEHTIGLMVKGGV